MQNCQIMKKKKRMKNVIRKNDGKCSNVKVIVDNKNKMVANNKKLKYEAIECYEDEGDYDK